MRLSFIKLPKKYSPKTMVRVVANNPLEISGIVNSPSRATINSEPIIAPAASPIRTNETIRSNMAKEVFFDKSSDSFL